MAGNKIGFAGKVIVGVLALFSLTIAANATDTLLIYNNSNFVDGAVVRVQHKSGALEEFDSSDSDYLAPPTGSLGIYSDINDPLHLLARDARPLDSNSPFNLKLVYNGNLASPKQNNLRFAFGTESFGTKPITFESSRLAYGQVADVRRTINSNSGNLPLINLVTGNYNVNNPYGEGILEIGTRLPCDFYEDGVISMKDFAVLAGDWQKTQGVYDGDISGPQWIPDGYVDNHDLQALSEDWLEDINDPSTW